MMNRYTSTLATRTLKAAGVILILSFLLDFLVLLFPIHPTDRAWQIALATALVDRGVVPLIGLGMLAAADAIETSDDNYRPGPLDLKFPAMILSSLLGLLFLIISPVHLNNMNQASTQAVSRINQEATQAENQLQGQVSQLKAQLSTAQAKTEIEKRRTQAKAQLTDLIKDDKKYNEVLNSPQTPAELKDVLRKGKTDPNVIDAFVAKQTDPEALSTQKLTEIRDKRDKYLEQSQQEALKSGLRIGLSSLLLSIGYIFIGWTGLRSQGVMAGGGGRKASVR